MSLAIVFPGQGSQSKGMLAGLEDKHPLVNVLYQTASEVLGYDLMELVMNGPEEELNKTEKTQPALLTAGVIVWQLWQQSGGERPAVLAGHSLGEYTALVAANVLDFSEAVALVRDRGRYMQEAVPAGEGAMAAILGLSAEDVETVCENNSGRGIVSVANYNSPGQVVIAGQSAAVEEAVKSAREAGAKRAVMLDVSVPSHCLLMKDVAGKFSDRLAEITFSEAVIPVIQNIDAQQRTGAVEIREALVRQLHQPVRWTETINNMKTSGVRKIVECGPGKVLTGLIKRIDRDLITCPAFDTDSLDSALAAHP